jgi:hypothetical protein
VKPKRIGILVVGAVCFVSVVGCQPTNQKASETLPFQISSNTNGYLVAFKNGTCWWSVDSNLLSMNLGLDSSVTFRLDPTNQALKSILLELRSKEGVKYFLSDMNADGTPETRLNAATGRREAFIKGSFYPMIEGGKGRQVSIDGITNELVMEQGQWQLR